MPHSNETSTNLSRPGSGLSLSVLGQYLHHEARKIVAIDWALNAREQQTLVDSEAKICLKFNREGRVCMGSSFMRLDGVE